MPSLTHEALVMLFRDNPELAVVFARATFQHRLPDGAVRVSSAEIADLQPAEYRADLVLCIEDPPGTVVQVIVVEVQLERDPTKRWRWPQYVANLRARYQCPVHLLVVTLSERVKRWYDEELDYGQARDEYVPRVLGPELIPVVIDADAAKAEPALAVLSAAAHGREPGAERIALAALQGCEDLDNEVATLYADLVRAFLGPAAQAALEAILETGKYQFQSKFANKYVQLGREEGLQAGSQASRAHDVLMVLEARSIAVTEAQRGRILECRDLDLLATWLRRAVFAESTADVFGSD